MLLSVLYRTGFLFLLFPSPFSIIDQKSTKVSPDSGLAHLGSLLYQDSPDSGLARLNSRISIISLAII